MKKTVSFIRYVFPVLLAFCLPLSAQGKKHMDLNRITRIGPQKSGIIAYQDASHTLPEGVFLKKGKSIAKKNLPQTSVNVYSIRRNGKLYLIDTGNGTGKGAFLRLLLMLGVSPDKIHGILLTHTHPDHIGGLLTADGKAIFPKAVIWLSKKEYEFADNGTSSVFSQFRRVRTAYKDRIRTFVPGDVVEGVFKTMAAYGHTPGHTVYECGRYLFAGDILHNEELQTADPVICVRFDADPANAVKSRRKILDYAAGSGKLLIGAHIAFPGSGKVAKNGSGYLFQHEQE